MTEPLAEYSITKSSDDIAVIRETRGNSVRSFGKQCAFNDFEMLSNLVAQANAAAKFRRWVLELDEFANEDEIMSCDISSGITKVAKLVRDETKKITQK